MKKNIYKFGFIISLLIIVALGIITCKSKTILPTVNTIYPNIATQYYIFKNDSSEMQTLQFQVCKTISYTVLGKFYGKKNGLNFQLDSIYFRPLIMSYSNKYDGKKLKLKNIKDSIISKDSNISKDEIMFTYSIELVESSEIFDTTYTVKNTKNIIDGMFIEFKPLEVPDFCKDSQVFGAFGVGGYECNGRGKVD